MYRAPVDAPISSSWDDHRRRTPPSTEPGTDFACAHGTDVRAAAAGRVVDVKHTTSTATGRYVTIDLDDGRRVRYLHLSAVLVGVGERVERGEVVARSGASGFGKEWHYGPHVHMTVWPTHAYAFGRDATIDPEPLIGEPAPATTTTTARPITDITQEDAMSMFICNVPKQGGGAKSFLCQPNPRAAADPKQKPFIAFVIGAGSKLDDLPVYDATQDFTWPYAEKYIENVNQN